MNSYWTRFLCLPVLMLTALACAAAPPVKIKLATLAPTGSSCHKSLLALRESWKNASHGSVDLVVYADGKLGGEADTVNLMSVSSVQASMLTAVGLSEIEPGVSGLQNIPMGFRSLDEVDYVGDKLHPLLQERLAKKGFVVLFWTDAGWVRFFAKKPITVPAELKKLKLFTWAGSPRQVEIYKSAGFNPVPLETADILPGLQTGLIEVVPAPPVYALVSQMDTRAPHMLELNWGPLVGACLIRKESWDRIPAEFHEAMLTSAAVAGTEIKVNARRESDDSVKAMEKRGLAVARITPEQEAQWRLAAEATYPQIRGTLVPSDVFDQALAAIKEYRHKPAK